jgi:aspartate racemase
LADKEMAEYFGLEYGTVNPFTIDPHLLSLPVLQIFDDSIFINKLPPYTMMTNAGDLQWGIEFNPDDLFKIIDIYEKGDVTKDSSFIRSIKSHKLGILTGNSPESGIKLWEDINNIVRKKLSHKFLGDISFPKVVVNSIPELGFSMELDKREQHTWKFVSNGVVSLCEQGCTMIAVACNTTQYFKDKISEICKKYNSRFFDMETSVDKYLSTNNIDRFDFLGIEYVTEFKHWSGFKLLNQKYNVVLPNDNDIKEISKIAYKVKQEGINGEGINRVRDLVNNATTTDTVLIALTELSILLASQKRKSRRGKIFIDTLELLAEEIALYYLKERNDL